MILAAYQGRRAVVCLILRKSDLFVRRGGIRAGVASCAHAPSTALAEAGAV